MPVQTVSAPLVAATQRRSRATLGGGTGYANAAPRGKGKQYINCYPYSEGGEVYIRPRNGWEIDTIVLSTGVTAVRGLFSWNVDGSVYSAIDSKVYKDTTANAATIVNGSASNVYFTSIDTGTQYVVALTEDKMYTYDTAFTQVAVTDGDFPTNLVPGIVSLDGFIFVMDNQGFIYNSNVNDPTAWNPEDFINAEYETDKGVAIHKLGNYVVALGSNTAQIFYNASLSPGSPLRPIKQATRNIGCYDANTVASAEDSMYWVAESDAPGSLGVVMLQGTTIKKISPPWVDAILDTYRAASGKGLPLSSTNQPAFCYRDRGQLLYVVSTGSSSICYNAINGEWAEWTAVTGGKSNPIQYSTNGILFGQPDQGYSGSDSFKCLQQHRNLGATSANTWISVDTNLEDIGNHNSATFTQNFFAEFYPVIITANINLGTRANKFHHILEVIGDKMTSTSNAVISYSDDDGNTWVAAGTVDMNDFRPQLHALGRFQERVFCIEMEAQQRIKALELTVNVGANAEGTNA